MKNVMILKNSNKYCLQVCVGYNWKDITYMNKRGHFDIELNSLEVKGYINYKDAKNDSIIYNF